MDSESKTFKYNVCKQVFNTPLALSRHTDAKYTHDGLQRNELNEVVFVCNVCSKTFRSSKNLYYHRRDVKHAIDSVVDVGEAMSQNLKKRKMSTQAMDALEMRYLTKNNV